MATRPFAFVLMPFEPQFDDIYKLGIQAVAADLGVVAERVDEQTFSEPILERIYRQIDTADFIIADMTGRNPNVFYEVGYAHAREKLCTLLTQSADDIPFDLKHHRHIVYNGSIQTLKGRLSAEIAWLKSEVEKRRTKTFTIEQRSVTADLTKNEWNAEAEVGLVFDIHNRTDRKSPEIEAAYLYTGKGWAFRQGDEPCPSTAADQGGGRVRHFIKTPVSRLSPGAWAQLRVSGKKSVWNKFTGEEPKESYILKGFLELELSTSEGSFKEQFNIETEAEEFPF